MKESISNFWLLSIVLIFILIFAAYLTVTLNYSKAFKIKNEVLSIIEKRNGITDDQVVKGVQSKMGAGTVMVPNSAQGTINAFLRASGYGTKGSCNGLEGKWYGVKELVYAKNPTNNVGYEIEEVKPTGKYYYCFSKKLRSSGCTNFGQGSNWSKLKNGAYYYDVLLFYKLELPVLGDLFVFNVEGTTMDIYNIADQRAGSCV